MGQPANALGAAILSFLGGILTVGGAWWAWMVWMFAGGEISLGVCIQLLLFPGGAMALGIWMIRRARTLQSTPRRNSPPRKWG